MKRLTMMMKNKASGEHVGRVGFDVTDAEADVLRSVWERNGATTVEEGGDADLLVETVRVLFRERPNAA